jgi:hypothetical protein
MKLMLLRSIPPTSSPEAEAVERVDDRLAGSDADEADRVAAEPESSLVSWMPPAGR